MNSELHSAFFVGFLIIQGTLFKILKKNFSSGLIGWHPVQPVHLINLYGALILVVLESKSYMDRAHKLQIDIGKYFGSILGLGLGSLQPTMNPYGFLVVKQVQN